MYTIYMKGMGCAYSPPLYKHRSIHLKQYRYGIIGTEIYMHFCV